MYRWVYWSAVTLFVVWTVFSAYSALTGCSCPEIGPASQRVFQPAARPPLAKDRRRALI